MRQAELTQKVVVLFDYAAMNGEEYKKLYTQFCEKFKDCLVIPSPESLLKGYQFAAHVKDPAIKHLYYVCTVKRCLDRTFEVVYENGFPSKRQIVYKQKC